MGRDNNGVLLDTNLNLGVGLQIELLQQWLVEQNGRRVTDARQFLDQRHTTPPLDPGAANHPGAIPFVITLLC